jgi:WD40 repeat protein
MVDNSTSPSEVVFGLIFTCVGYFRHRTQTIVPIVLNTPFFARMKKVARTGVNGVAWSPDGARLASASSDERVRVWDAATGSLLFSCKGHEGQVWGVAWSPDGMQLASASEDKTVRVWWVDESL